MRSSTQVIAQSLEEFSRCLKETELPNDAETTQAIIDTQKSERESIKVKIKKLFFASNFVSLNA